jgi:hypothetical protein
MQMEQSSKPYRKLWSGSALIYRSLEFLLINALWGGKEEVFAFSTKQPNK